MTIDSIKFKDNIFERSTYSINEINHENKLKLFKNSIIIFFTFWQIQCKSQNLCSVFGYFAR